MIDFKTILFILILALPITSMGISHNILSGFLHKGGSLNIGIKQENVKQFKAIFDYQVKPKLLVPFPKKFRSGHFEQLLPIEFLTREGYEILERDKTLTNDQATLIFLGREDVGLYTKSYKLKILPVSNKWEGILFYNNNVNGIGWLKAELIIKDIKFLGKYKLNSELDDGSI
jgi:hypothetical protein